jgi:serine transporter
MQIKYTTSQNAKKMKKLNSENAYWTFTLFGTAVGAGILFLPVQAGVGGIWVFAVAALFIWLMVFPPMHYYALIVSKTPKPIDFTGAIKLYLGRKAGIVLNLLFMLFLFVLLVAYSIGLNNDVGSLIYENHLLTVNPAHGPFLSLVILVLFMLILKYGGSTLIKVLGTLSVVLIFLLLGITVLLAEMWDFSRVTNIPTGGEFLKQFFLVFPILIMSFMFFSVISPMIIRFRVESLNEGDVQKRSNGILKAAVILLMTFVLLFVLSCLLALDPVALERANQENISVLALLGENSKNPFLDEFGPAISLIALTTSFFGVALGFRESSLELINEFVKSNNSKKSNHVSEIVFYAFSVISLWLITILNINIIDLFGELIAPLNSVFLYIVPVVIIYKIHSFRTYRKPMAIVVFVSGIFLVVSYFLGKIL